MYNAAVKSKDKTIDFQQIAVSYAAHNVLAWIFQGTRLYPYIDQALKTIQTRILATAGPFNSTEAILTGRQAARDSRPIGASRKGHAAAKDRAHQSHYPSQHHQSPVMIARTACLAALLRSRIDKLALQKQQLEMSRWRLAASLHIPKKLRAAVDRLDTSNAQHPQTRDYYQ